MELFKPGTTIDFLQFRRPLALVSGSLVLASIVSLFVPGPNFGIDFRGGTEVEVQLDASVHAGELRAAVSEQGYSRPEVIGVADRPGRYIVRVRDVSSLSDEQVERVRGALAKALGDIKIDQMRVSPGGDKISLRLSAEAEPSMIQTALEAGGAKVRSVNRFGQDHRFEAMLVGVGDEIVAGLASKFSGKGPTDSLRIEWVGPKAGQQLRTAALQAALYALAFILVYVAFRFDLRFAPGSILCLLHDALITIGAYVLLQKEFNLSTVAAILTVIGYSINDTIVVYDRIRENMQRMRDAKLADLINASVSQTLSRTVITSGTTLLAISGFFFWGTPVIQDIAFALSIGFVVGTYSSIYVAAALTEWLDRRVFSRV